MIVSSPAVFVNPEVLGSLQSESIILKKNNFVYCTHVCICLLFLVHNYRHTCMQTYRETDRHAGRQTDRYMHTLFTTKKPHLISTRAALISPVDTMHFLLVTRSRLSASCVMDTIHGTPNFWLEATFDLHFIHFSIHNHLASSDPDFK